MKQPTILIIDDNLVNLKVEAVILHNHGYNVVSADNGESGIICAHESMPDVIILDLMMPGLNGFEVCDILKKSDDTRRIPIIFCTAYTSSTNLSEYMHTGAFDVIRKPIDMHLFISRVRAALQLNQLDGC
jgi:CheY-like chemotaxis protein